MDEKEVDLGSLSSFESNSISSSSLEFIDDATSSSSSNGNWEEEEGSLFDMSNLFAQLPFKSGLSKHFQGKSQSFSSLSDVKIVEDLAKPERSYKKKLKPSKSYGRVLDSNKGLSCAKGITKKSSRGSFCSLGTRKKVFFGSKRLPFPSFRSL